MQLNTTPNCADDLKRAAAQRLARLPLHCREAGVRRAEKALEELTAAANQLNVGDIFTEHIVALWNAFQRGGPPRLVRHKAPRIDKPTPQPAEGLAPRRDVQAVLNSPEGRAALQDVLLGLLSLREAARRLNAHPNSVLNAVRCLRKAKQRQAATANDSAETALTFSLKSH